MLASEVYWWIMLKNTLKDHTEEDFIIPEEELNTQYHQIAYDYHNPKRLFNQSNVVILNKKQKKKLNELQQEELMLQQLEQKKNTNPSNSTLDRQQQNKNRIDQYIKERIANDHESNYEYMRQHQPHQNFQGSLSSTSKLIKNKDSENESESDNDDLINLKDRNKNEQEATIVEMYSSPNNVYPRKTSISSSSSSSSSVFIHPYSQQSYPSTFRKNSNTTTVNSNTIFIDMKNNSMSIDQPQLSLHNNNNTINMEIDSAAPLSTQKNKILEYMDQLIKENKEKKQAKKKEKQDNPERYHYNHPQEWFSQMMGVKEIQEERDAKIFVRAKQKREKEIIEQKMEKLKNELNYANTSEQVEAIFNELKALNGIW
ncbi:hypothetical protein BCR36DRAFT_84962 [Piromyces finnis]|uniref:Uncharacterized protein n=1 Tax=Piromyces finnis TaxID=1754191 RepID=A0A1Y1V5L6_9FUNG|nr:hypothetical protein BCR36DRAFT_84962 [Piromyces finnis]|eukprot:ORX47849.1 hypothetical protein BCR36DRAFT_84962 [Piromyces finnis]